MSITKGLIIDDPWIGYILEGRKTWEMRSRTTSFRGCFGLIRKGTGAVWGVATLVDVGTPLSTEELLASIDKHCVPEETIRGRAVSKWNIPWRLADVKALREPVLYTHKSGAVTWVKLAPAVSAAIERQLDAERGRVR